MDVTYALGDAESDGTINGDYFGDVALSNNGIIMTKEVYITVNRGDTNVTLNLLQSYAWWYWGPGADDMTSAFTLLSTLN